MKFCEECGAQLRDNARFCTACGIPVDQATEMPRLPVCKKCGEELEESTAFCTSCGEPCQEIEPKLVAEPKPAVKIYGKYGVVAEDASEFHQNSGKIFHDEVPTYGENKLGTEIAPTGQTGNTDSHYKWVIALAIVIILDVLLVPFVSVWGGLIPDFDDDFGTIGFFDIVERIGDYGLETFGDTDALMVTVALGFAIGILIAAVKENRGACLTCSILAALVLSLLLIIVISEAGSDVVFGEYCSISIGFWIALISHIAIFICSVNIQE